jgi:magnesium transporter
MLKKLYKAVEHEVDYVRQELNRIEANIFAGHEVMMVESISKNARDLLNLRQIIEPHREVLQEFENLLPTFFGEEFRAYAQAISHEYYRVHNHIMRNTESLHELRETNNSLLSTKQNETMRVLTTIALLTFPLTLFVSLFDVNSESNPVTHSPNGFWIIIGTVVVTGALMLWYFRHKKWL